MPQAVRNPLVDVLIVIPRDHEYESFITGWNLRPTDPFSTSRFVLRSESNSIEVQVATLDNLQGHDATRKKIEELLQVQRARLVLLAGTAGFVPGDRKRGDVCYHDSENVVVFSTSKANADGSFGGFGASKVAKAQRPFRIEFEEVKKDWRTELTKSLPGIAPPEVFRTVCLVSANTRCSDPVIAEAFRKSGYEVVEMELAGAIEACNLFHVSVASIRVGSDVVGQLKRDEDSIEAGKIAGSAVRAFLSIPSIQSTIKNLTFSATPSSPVRTVPRVIRDFGDLIESASVKPLLTSQERKSIYKQALKYAAEYPEAFHELLEPQLVEACISCGNKVDFFAEFESIFDKVASTLPVNKRNVNFLAKVSELRVGLGKPPLSRSLDGFDSLELRRKIAHTQGGGEATHTMLSLQPERQEVSHDAIASWLNCQLCHSIWEVNESTYQARLLKVVKTAELAAKPAVHLGKAYFLAAIRLWLQRPDGWKTQLYTYLDAIPPGSPMPPVERVLYLRFLQDRGTGFSFEERVSLAKAQRNLKAAVLESTCLFSVKKVLEISELDSQLVELCISVARTILREDRAFS